MDSDSWSSSKLSVCVCMPQTTCVTCLSPRTWSKAGIYSLVLACHGSPSETTPVSAYRYFSEQHLRRWIPTCGWHPHTCLQLRKHRSQWWHTSPRTTSSGTQEESLGHVILVKETANALAISTSRNYLPANNWRLESESEKNFLVVSMCSRETWVQCKLAWLCSGPFSYMEWKTGVCPMNLLRSSSSSRER